MRVLVTGGTGFLGRAVVERFAARGDRVRVLARGHRATDLPAGVELHRGDVGDLSSVGNAAAGCDLVVHTAALAGIAGPRAEYERVNVGGTRNVVEACRRHRVPRLVHTSTPSVVFDGTSMEGVDERVPLATRFEAAYPETKAAAERMALGANGPDLAVVALRPHLVWGPGDHHLVPRILARARAGTLALVGDGSNRVDATFIDNAADAHVAAADRLAPGAPCAGRAYFVANGEPIPLRRLLDLILGAAGLPPVARSVSPRAALAAGWVLEAAHALLGLHGEPRMTRFLARELSTAHWFDLGAARRDLGWEPRVTTEEGMVRLAAWIRGGGA
ncbi:MAG: NAD-dependent epimerase/dehydratase family protein [Planctomycetes bacterium]|nr:NAD-dependent epimerase/dehydratase family protein [Planctomycetota bacterium]